MAKNIFAHNHLTGIYYSPETIKIELKLAENIVSEASDNLATPYPIVQSLEAPPTTKKSDNTSDNKFATRNFVHIRNQGRMYFMKNS